VCSPSGLVSFLISGLDFSGFEHPRSFLQLIFSSVGFGFPLRGIFSPLVLGFASLLRSGSWCRPRQSLSSARSPRQSSCSRFSFFAADFCCLHFFAWVQCIASSAAKESPRDFAFGPVYSSAVSFVKSSADLSFLCSFCAPRSTHPMLWPVNKERLSASLRD
jgi:hypothetical protein